MEKRMRLTQEKLVTIARILVWVAAIIGAVAVVYHEAHKYDRTPHLTMNSYIGFGGGSFWPPDMVPHPPHPQPIEPGGPGTRTV